MIKLNNHFLELKGNLQFSLFLSICNVLFFYAKHECVYILHIE
jgi:hypothetical protein